MFRVFAILMLKICATIIIVYLFLSISTTPSNEREWNSDQAILPYAEFKGNTVTVHNIRNFAYTSTTNYTPHYYDKEFNLGDIQRVWYVVEPFSGFPGQHILF